MTPRDPIKVYDARWEVDEFADDQVRRLFESALAYGRQIGVDTVSFTRDARQGCPRVLEIGISEALRLGFRTFLRAEPVSTPQAYFTSLRLSQEFPGTMGLAVTASHNPRQYVGVKFTVPVVSAIGYDCGPMGGLKRIREIYHSPARFDGVAGGSLRLIDLSREYIEWSMKAAGVARGQLAGLNVVLDALNGSAGPELCMAMQEAGVGVRALRLLPDGSFPTGSPNPISRGKMDDAVRLAEQQRCDAVIGVDGDGDRLVFGDGRGILTAGFAFVPILQGLGPGAQDGAPAVLYDPKVSPLALAEWGRLGARPVLFRNGHSQIKDYMVRVSGMAAAEESGHYYHRLEMGPHRIAAENSVMTILLFLSALQRAPGLMDRLWEMQGRIFTTGEFNYEFESDELRERAQAEVVRQLVADGCATRTATDDGIDLEGTCIWKGVGLETPGVRLAPGWYSGYLRSATTEKGVARSYFSAADAGVGRRVEQLVRGVLADRFGGRAVE